MTTEYASSPVVAALERAWDAIRSHHPEVPEVIVILASGTETKASKLGHYAIDRWKVAGQEDTRPEVLIAGEGLNRGANGTLETLLHEAAHGLAFARDVKDVSRGGRYHNKRYCELAAEVGLMADEIPPFGFSRTTLTGPAVLRYAATILDLEAVLQIRRLSEDHKVKASRNLPKAQCACDPPRSMRISKSTLTQGPVLCGLCAAPFELDA